MTITPHEPDPVDPVDDDVDEETESEATRFAVYDHAELRFVTDPVSRKEADKVAKDRTTADKSKSGRADGKRGKRFEVRPVD